MAQVEHIPEKHRSFWRYFKVPAFSLGIILFMAWIALPNLDGPHRQQFLNEAVTVSRIREITELQKLYSAAHPDEGFACDLARLKSVKEANDLEQLLISGERSGYTFALLNCHPDQNGRVSHYQVTAVPIEPGKTGFRTFCSTEGNVIHYGKGAPIEDCLSFRNTIE